ncbi:MAG: glycoside hydrolase family 95 protein, partial [Lachnospiraceae bacterium]|nr:glycoside hydrolase family 95 protein [Lachnospiraceae bacterium]
MDKLFYKMQAKNWNEALPLGNGFMGAMCFGGTDVDRFQLNNDSVWNGGYKNRINPSAKEKLTEIRELIRQGKISEAEDLANEALAAVPDCQCHYEPLCDLFFINETGKSPMYFGLAAGWNGVIYNGPEVSDYVRELDIEKGIHRVSYEYDGVRWERESFISYPDRVMQINSKGKGARIIIERGAFPGEMSYPDENTIMMHGRAGGDGVTYAVAVRCVKGFNGRIGRTIHISEDSIVLVASETSFYEENPENACLNA